CIAQIVNGVLGATGPFPFPSARATPVPIASATAAAKIVFMVFSLLNRSALGAGPFVGGLEMGSPTRLDNAASPHRIYALHVGVVPLVCRYHVLPILNVLTTAFL